MNIIEFQQQLIHAIKLRLPSDASIADELAKLLNISSDSAYRRMRGEKLISLEELYTICTHFKLSLDQLMNIETGSIVFQGNYVSSKTFRFEQYMSNLVQILGYMNSFKQKELFYICKDMPIFHHYHLREIAAFKWFFWLKTYLHFPDFEKRKFKISDYPDELHTIDQQVLNIYNQIPSVEIWNIESMNIIFRQIDFYREGGIFASDEDVYTLYDKLDQLWDHLEKQAALGYKFRLDDPLQKRTAEYKMYFNEVLLGDNTIMAVLDGAKMSYINHTTINIMMTRDLAFNENLYAHLMNLMKRSTLISTVSEKERGKFFRIIRERINKRKEALV